MIRLRDAGGFVSCIHSRLQTMEETFCSWRPDTLNPAIDTKGPLEASVVPCNQAWAVPPSCLLRVLAPKVTKLSVCCYLTKDWQTEPYLWHGKHLQPPGSSPSTEASKHTPRSKAVSSEPPDASLAKLTRRSHPHSGLGSSTVELSKLAGWGNGVSGLNTNWLEFRTAKLETKLQRVGCGTCSGCCLADLQSIADNPHAMNPRTLKMPCKSSPLFCVQGACQADSILDGLAVQGSVLQLQAWCMLASSTSSKSS